MESNQSGSLKLADHLTLCLMVCSTFLYRMFILPRFAGWEESDYGNLAMVRGVFDSGFSHFDMNHMPGYYALGALALFITDNTEVAAKAAALVPNMIAVFGGLWIGKKHLGTLWTLVLWFCLTFQPELALYSTSALREPSYAAWLILFLVCLNRKSYFLGGLCVALAFTVRFEAPLVLGLVFLWAIWFVSKKEFLKLVSPLIATIAIWMIYCQMEHGTWQFWGHAAAVNVETGLGAENSGAKWGGAGLKIAFQLMTEVLPWRMGLGFWLCTFPGLFIGLRNESLRWLTLTALGSLGVWLGIAAIAQHEVGHNLYWKWMYPVVFLLFFSAVLGLKTLVRPLPKSIQICVVVAIITQAGWGFQKETVRQMSRSQELYAPQVSLAIWIEDNIPEGEAIILDNIPACYINRYPNEHQLISWFDVPTHGEGEFADYLLSNEVSHVLWFEESWTQAPLVAPFLQSQQVWQSKGVTLTLLEEDNAYGWRWFKVRHP